MRGILFCLEAGGGGVAMSLKKIPVGLRTPANSVGSSRSSDDKGNLLPMLEGFMDGEQKGLSGEKDGIFTLPSK